MAKEPTIYESEKHVWVKACKECKGEFPNHEKSCKHYHEKGRVIGIHDNCGGKIIAWSQCRQCEKCKEFFCGCACM